MGDGEERDAFAAEKVSCSHTYAHTHTHTHADTQTQALGVGHEEANSTAGMCTQDAQPSPETNDQGIRERLALAFRTRVSPLEHSRTSTE